MALLKPRIPWQIYVISPYKATNDFNKSTYGYLSELCVFLSSHEALKKNVNYLKGCNKITKLSTLNDVY